MKYKVGQIEIELTPNKDKTRYLVTFDGFLSFERICTIFNTNYEIVQKMLIDCGAYPLNGNVYFNKLQDAENFIVAFKLISG